MIYNAPHNAWLRELICYVGDYIATNFIIIMDIIYKLSSSIQVDKLPYTLFGSSATGSIETLCTICSKV